MNTNKLAEVIGNFLITKCARVYRNRPYELPTPIYIIYSVGEAVDTYPSYDYALQIDIFDKNDVECSALETLADSIQADLDHRVINNTTLNAQFELSSRTFIRVNDLVEAQMVRLIYNVRVYFK